MEIILQGRPRNLSQEMYPRNILEKVGSRSKTGGGLIRVLSGLEREVILKGEPRNLSQEMHPRDILEKAGSRSKTWWDLFHFRRVLKGSSFCRSGPEACDKTCAQGSF